MKNQNLMRWQSSQLIGDLSQSYDVSTQFRQVFGLAGRTLFFRLLLLF